MQTMVERQNKTQKRSTIERAVWPSSYATLFVKCRVQSTYNCFTFAISLNVFLFQIEGWKMCHKRRDSVYTKLHHSVSYIFFFIHPSLSIQERCNRKQVPLHDKFAYAFIMRVVNISDDWTDMSRVNQEYVAMAQHIWQI